MSQSNIIIFSFYPDIVEFPDVGTCPLIVRSILLSVVNDDLHRPIYAHWPLLTQNIQFLDQRILCRYRLLILSQYSAQYAVNVGYTLDLARVGVKERVQFLEHS